LGENYLTQKTNKLYSFLLRIFGWFLLFIAITQFVFAIVKYTSVEEFIINISSSVIVILLISLLMLTHYYSFNDDNLTWHCYFLKKDIPIYTIIEIQYYIFGLFFLTVRRETLNTKGTIFITLFCSKKKSLKKLTGFFEILARKNMSCIIKI